MSNILEMSGFISCLRYLLQRGILLLRDTKLQSCRVFDCSGLAVSNRPLSLYSTWVFSIITFRSDNIFGLSNLGVSAMTDDTGTGNNDVFSYSLFIRKLSQLSKILTFYFEQQMAPNIWLLWNKRTNMWLSAIPHTFLISVLREGK